MIFFYILISLLFAHLSGSYATRLIAPQSKINTIFYLGFGYAITQMLFLIGIYTLGVKYSLYAIFILFLAFSVVSIKDITKVVKTANYKTILLAALLTLVFSYNFIIYGAGNYWHTASEDCFDALDGKDYILGNLIELKDFLSSEEAIKNFENTRGNIASFLYSDIALQYSSVAFWSLFFNLHANFDPFMIQISVTLIIMFFGVFLLLKQTFKFSNTISYTVAFFSTYSNLYYGTYINTHLGSLMFGAVIPYVLYIFFSLDQMRYANKRLVILLILMSMFLLFTYKHPYAFFFIPALTFIIIKNSVAYTTTVINNKIFTLLATIITLISAYFIIDAFQYYQNFRDSRYRSWGISLEPEMLLIYWGLVRSQITNIGSHTSIYHSEILKYALYTISIFYTTVTAYGFLKLSKLWPYFKHFVFFWVIFFVVFKFMLADSYYFYKFLYTTQFIFLIFFFYGITIMLASKRCKLLAIVLVVAFSASNVGYNIYSNYKVYEAPFNQQSAMFKQISAFPPDLIEHAYLDIPKQHYRAILKSILRRNNIFTEINIENANYILMIKNIDDVHFDFFKNREVVLENETFKLIKKPEQYLSLYGGWDSEIFESEIGGFCNTPFKWMSHNIGPIYINTNINNKHLQICFESGPSIDFGIFDIYLDENKKRIQGASCEYFILPATNTKHRLYSNIKGKRLLPFDERTLEYKVANLRLVDTKYNDDVLTILNPKNDVANQDFTKKNNIVLGNGWYPQELPNMRWGSNNVELIVLNTTKNSIDVEFEIEPGPTLSDLPLTIEIFNQNDEKIGYLETSSKTKLSMAIPVKPNERYQILKLKVLNKTHRIESDPRDLNFRLFSVRSLN